MEATVCVLTERTAWQRMGMPTAPISFMVMTLMLQNMCMPSLGMRFHPVVELAGAVAVQVVFSHLECKSMMSTAAKCTPLVWGSLWVVVAAAILMCLQRQKGLVL